MAYKQDEKGRFIKVAVITWTVDPEGTMRFLMRHNKPFNGYDDEWTVTFGNIELDETIESGARREVEEEFGIKDFSDKALNLNYEIEYEGKHGKTVIYFFAIQVPNIDTKVALNEESIGYDWMKIDDAKKVMQHEDERKAFDVLTSKIEKKS